MSDDALSPLKQARRAKIVAAAEHLFVAQGYRATTMEGIASAANMSKVTVYGYFSDKDVLFDAVAGTIAQDMQDAFDAAISEAAPASETIIAALIAKHDVVRERVRKSPFAPELFTAKDRASTKRFADLDAGFIRQITQKLVADGCQTPDARTRAQVLFAASQGIANAAESTSAMRDQIKMLGVLISERG